LREEEAQPGKPDASAAHAASAPKDHEPYSVRAKEQPQILFELRGLDYRNHLALGGIAATTDDMLRSRPACDESRSDRRATAFRADLSNLRSTKIASQ
jgi:hypothetical protein